MLISTPLGVDINTPSEKPKGADPDPDPFPYLGWKRGKYRGSVACSEGRKHGGKASSPRKEATILSPFGSFHNNKLINNILL